MYVLIRDDRHHDDGEAFNLVGYKNHDYAIAVCARLNAAVQKFRTDLNALAQRGQEDVSDEYHALVKAIVHDLNAIVPEAGDAYSNLSVNFRLQNLPVID